MSKAPSRDIPGPVNTGEFAPLETPLTTPESVTTADTQRTRHSQSMPATKPSGKMTKEWIPSSIPVRK